MLYILPEETVHYSGLPAKPMVPATLATWKEMLKPLSLLAPGAVLAGAFLHYLIKGPKDVSEHQAEKEGCNHDA
jgi:hypothetical protein